MRHCADPASFLNSSVLWQDERLGDTRDTCQRGPVARDLIVLQGHRPVILAFRKFFCESSAYRRSLGFISPAVEQFVSITCL